MCVSVCINNRVSFDVQCSQALNHKVVSRVDDWFLAGNLLPFTDWQSCCLYFASLIAAAQ